MTTKISLRFPDMFNPVPFRGIAPSFIDASSIILVTKRFDAIIPQR